MNDKFAASRLSFGGESISITYEPPCLTAENFDKLKEKIKKYPHHSGIWFVFKKNDEGHKYDTNPIKYLKIQDGKEDVEHQFP